MPSAGEVAADAAAPASGEVVASDAETPVADGASFAGDVSPFVEAQLRRRALRLVLDSSVAAAIAADAPWVPSGPGAVASAVAAAVAFVVAAVVEGASDWAPIEVALPGAPWTVDASDGHAGVDRVALVVDASAAAAAEATVAALGLHGDADDGAGASPWDSFHQGPQAHYWDDFGDSCDCDGLRALVPFAPGDCPSRAHSDPSSAVPPLL